MLSRKTIHYSFGLSLHEVSTEFQTSLTNVKEEYEKDLYHQAFWVNN